MDVLLRTSVAIEFRSRDVRYRGSAGADSGRWSGTNRLKKRGLSNAVAWLNFNMREDEAAERGEGAKQVTKMANTAV
jgi:hypothetical protein